MLARLLGILPLVLRDEIAEWYSAADGAQMAAVFKKLHPIWPAAKIDLVLRKQMRVFELIADAVPFGFQGKHALHAHPVDVLAPIGVVSGENVVPAVCQIGCEAKSRTLARRRFLRCT